jgi:uncharacterized damage-inducible protein DinB
MRANDERLGEETVAAARAELDECRRKIRHCVEQLTDEQVWHRAGESFNSVANLLLHLNGNLSERIVSLLGGAPLVRDRAAEFAARGPIAKGELLATLEDTFERCDEVLSRLTPDQLLETCRFRMLRGEVKRSKMRVLWQTLVHLGGHTQEIVALSRLQMRELYRFMQ